MGQARQTTLSHNSHFFEIKGCLWAKVEVCGDTEGEHRTWLLRFGSNPNAHVW